MRDETDRRPSRPSSWPERVEWAFGMVQDLVDSGRVPGAAMLVGHSDCVYGPRAFGRMGPAEAPPVQPDTNFLVASLTKPVTATAICLLLERGLVALNQPVRELIPELGPDKDEVRLLHLLTHTSGLPDMLPNNEELRAAHQSLETFIEHICRVPLDFPPGRKVQYQSCGIALLAEIVRRVTGDELRDFLSEELFGPLGMSDTFLGRRDEDRSRISDVSIAPVAAATDWHWNSDYWHRFGAPWGGLFSTVRDYGRFLKMLLQGGEIDGVRVLSPVTVDRMTTNHMRLLSGLSAEDRLSNAWSLGWQMACPTTSDYLGDLLSPRAFGHGGATGTGAWADPATGLRFVLFTNQPELGREIGLVSNAVAASVG